MRASLLLGRDGGPEARVGVGVLSPEALLAPLARRAGVAVVAAAKESDRVGLSRVQARRGEDPLLHVPRQVVDAVGGAVGRDRSDGMTRRPQLEDLVAVLGAVAPGPREQRGTARRELPLV